MRGEAGMAGPQAYSLSIERAPDYAPAWGALGRHYARTGDNPRALQCLEHYLELAPEARDAPFARQTVEKLRQSAQPTLQEQTP